MGNEQAPNFTADDRIQQALQAFFVVVHARTKVRDQLKCPALPGAQNSSRTCFFSLPDRPSGRDWTDGHRRQWCGLPSPAHEIGLAEAAQDRSVVAHLLAPCPYCQHPAGGLTQAHLMAQATISPRACRRAESGRHGEEPVILPAFYPTWVS